MVNAWRKLPLSVNIQANLTIRSPPLASANPLGV
jgi:hypothetical protein